MILAGNQKINYIYSASGEKLACDANGSSTYYLGGVMVYGDDDKLLYILTPEGTVSRSEGVRRNFLHLQLLQERPYRKYAGRALGRRRYAANGSVHRLLSFRTGFLDEQPEQEQISVLRERVAGRNCGRFYIGTVRFRYVPVRRDYRQVDDARPLCAQISGSFTLQLLFE